MLFQESDIKFESLDSDSFEELCFDLLARLGFHSLVWRQGGADSGRDIEASYTVAHPLVKHYDDRWFVECKRYTGGVPVEELASKVAWAEAEKPAHFLIITKSDHMTLVHSNSTLPRLIVAWGTRPCQSCVD
jgi:HJR/Mrr/RecB family endonuclease